MGDVWVEGDRGGFEAIAEYHVAFVGAVAAVVGVVGFGGVAVEGLVAEVAEAIEGGLFDLVFADVVGHGVLGGHAGGCLDVEVFDGEFAGD